MKNPFKRSRPAPDAPAAQPQTVPEPAPEPEIAIPPEEKPADVTPPDDFVEWRRTQIRGGIERRERNDFFEAYSVFGTNADGKLLCRYYHRYPEHERDFDLSYTRELSFDDFNRRLLSELDKGDLKLGDYNFCIKNAAELTHPTAQAYAEYSGFTDGEFAVLQEFCESIDTLKDRSYLHGDGIFSCECESVVGGESLNLRFRKPLAHDAILSDISGVRKESVAGYDIGDMWIMSVYNRLRDRCASCAVSLLTSEWSLEQESVWLIAAEGFPGIDGTVFVAVAEASAFRRFGFYSLDFSKK